MLYSIYYTNGVYCKRNQLPTRQAAPVKRIHRQTVETLTSDFQTPAPVLATGAPGGGAPAFVTEVEIGVVARRRSAVAYEGRFYITGAVAKLAQALIGERHREHLLVIGLSTAGRAVAYNVASSGTINGTVVNTRMVAEFAFSTNSARVVIAHNHPSGELLPSDADDAVTRNVREGCRVLDIGFQDHLIVGPEPGRYYSYSQKGRL